MVRGLRLAWDIDYEGERLGGLGIYSLRLSCVLLCFPNLVKLDGVGIPSFVFIYV